MGIRWWYWWSEETLRWVPVLLTEQGQMLTVLPTQALLFLPFPLASHGEKLLNHISHVALTGCCSWGSQGSGRGSQDRGGHPAGLPSTGGCRNDRSCAHSERWLGPSCNPGRWGSWPLLGAQPERLQRPWCREGSVWRDSLQKVWSSREGKWEACASSAFCLLQALHKPVSASFPLALEAAPRGGRSQGTGWSLGTRFSFSKIQAGLFRCLSQQGPQLQEAMETNDHVKYSRLRLSTEQ